MSVLQDAAAHDAGDNAWQLHLNCLLATACLQLPPPPAGAAQTDVVQPLNDAASAVDPDKSATEAGNPAVLHQQMTEDTLLAEAREPANSLYPLTKDTYAAVKVLSTELALHFAAWHKKAQASSNQAEGLSTALANVQWQLAGLVAQLYALLFSSAAAQSPSHQSLNIKVLSQGNLVVCKAAGAVASDAMLPAPHTCKLCLSIST